MPVPARTIKTFVLSRTIAFAGVSSVERENTAAVSTIRYRLMVRAIRIQPSRRAQVLRLQQKRVDPLATLNPNAALERNHVDERSRRYPETELYLLALVRFDLMRSHP